MVKQWHLFSNRLHHTLLLIWMAGHNKDSRTGFENMKFEKSKLFLQLGLCLLFFTLLGVYFRFDSMKWALTDIKDMKSVPGLITKSEVGNKYRGWYFFIEYEYVVDNIKYKSDRVHFGFQGATDIDYAQSYVNEYPIGRQVEVYYQSGNANFSVLEPEVREYQQFIIIGVNFILILIFIYLSATFYKKGE